MSAKKNNKTDNKQKKEDTAMPQIVTTSSTSEVTATKPASDKKERATRVAVDRSRITFAEVPCEAHAMSIDGEIVATLYKSGRGTIARCNDRASLPAMPGILEFHPTEVDKDGNPVVTLDKLTAWTTAGMSELWGKTAKPFSTAQLEFIEFRVSKGDSQEAAEKKARAI